MPEPGDIVEVIANGRYKGLRFKVEQLATTPELGLLIGSPFTEGEDENGEPLDVWFEDSDIRRVNKDCDKESPLTFDYLMTTINKG